MASIQGFTVSKLQKNGRLPKNMHHIHRPRALRPVPNFFHWTYARTGWICCCLFTKNIINFAFRFKLVYVCHHRGLKWSYASHSGGDTRYTITVLENTVRGSRDGFLACLPT